MHTYILLLPYIRARIYTHYATHTYTHMHINVHTHTHTHIYANAYTCTHTRADIVPDKDKPAAEAQFKRISAAYEVIMSMCVRTCMYVYI